MTAADEIRRPAQKTKAKARAGRGWYAVLARVGLLAKGVSYALVGALALKLAFGHGGKATSRDGALRSVAQHAFGKILLIVLALGFAAYAIWRFVQAFAEREEEDDAAGFAKTWGKRAGYVGRGVIYSSLTYSAARIVTGSGAKQSQNRKAHETTATVFDWPAGRWLVGFAGIVLVGVAGWNLLRGLARKFEDRWRVGGLSPAWRRWGGRVGVAGHLARAVVFALIGVFVTKAAIDFDPQKAIGLDGALQKLARASYGPWLLGVTGAGLLAYGFYCLVDARLRDVSTSG